MANLVKIRGLDRGVSSGSPLSSPGFRVRSATSGIHATATTALTGTNNDLVYTSVDGGPVGNTITIAYTYVDPSTDSQPAVVTVSGRAISVAAGTTAGAAASYTTALTGANNDLVYTAKAAGSAGNSITIAYLDPGSDSQALSVSVATDAISVHLATNAGAAAAYTTSLTGANNDLVFTAKAAGSAGDAISVTYVDPGGTTATLGVVTTGNDIVVNLGRTASAIDSTATAVAAAIAANTAANALISVANAAANDGTGLVTAMTIQHLTGGGVGYAITSTAALVSAAVAASTAANALVSVANAPANDGSGVVTALSAQNLTGGGVGYTASTAAQIAAAVAANSTSAAMVTAANATGNDGTGAVTAMSPITLSGGAYDDALGHDAASYVVVNHGTTVTVDTDDPGVARILRRNRYRWVEVGTTTV